MTTEKNDDLDNKTGQPWLLIDEEYVSVDNVELIDKALAEVRDSHGMMTLVSDDGQVFEGSLLVNIKDGLLRIDKPLDWDDHNNSFRVFFRDHKKYWRFFRVDSVTYSPFSLTLEIPATIFLLQRRRYKRVPVPPGTRAMVKIGQEQRVTLYVRDLSASGMLFCDSSPVDEYPIDDSFHDIMISVPRGGSDSAIPVRKVMPVIGRARVVRSFVDEKTSRSCYGIAFEYDSNHVREELCRLVKDVELAA